MPRPYIAYSGMEAGCVICLADTPEQPTAGDNCTHVFCRDCIERWLTQKNECPTCRAPLVASAAHSEAGGAAVSAATGPPAYVAVVGLPPHVASIGPAHALLLMAVVDLVSPSG